MRIRPISALSGRRLCRWLFAISIFFVNNTTVLANSPTVPYSQNTTFELLTANFALYRNDPATALHYFLSQAKHHKTLHFAKLASQLALSQRNDKALLEASTHWLDAAPYSGDAYYFSSLAMAFNKYPITALAYMREAEFHQHPTDYTRLAKLTNDDNRVQAAYLKALQFADDISYTNYDAIIALCLLLVAQDKPESVPVLLEKALEHGQHNPSVFDYASQIYLSLGQPKKALKLYEKGVILHPSQLGLRLKLAILAQTVAPELAKIQFEILQFYLPDNLLVKKRLGGLYINTGKLQQAQALFLQLLKHPSESSFAKHQLASIATLGNKPATALTYLSSIPLNDQTPAIQRDLIRAYIQSHNWHKARRLIRSSLKKNRNTLDRIQLKILHIAQLVAQGKNRQALKTLYRYRSDHPQNDDLFLLSATIAAQSLNNPSFTRHMKALLKTRPDNLYSLKTLGIHIASQTLPHTETRRILKSLLSLAPDNPVLLDTYGWLLYRIDFLDNARVWVSRAFELQPNTRTGTHLGEILWLLGDKEDARRIFNQAAQMTPGDPELHNTIERLHVTLSPNTTT